MSEHQNNLTKHPELKRREGTIFLGVFHILRKANNALLVPFKNHFKKRYHGKYRHARVLYAIDLGLVALLIALAGLTIWTFFFRSTLADQITLTVEATPRELISGERVTYTVFYENRSKETLTNVNLGIRLPAHFQFLQSYPKSKDIPRLLFLDQLAPGDHGQAKITGIFWGAVGTPAIIFNTLSFTEEKNVQRGIKFARTEFPVTRSIFEVSPNFPEQGVGGQTLNFNLHYRNSADRDLTNVHIIPDWPVGFRFSGSVPPLSDGRWKIGDLVAQQEGLITVTGNLPTGNNKIDFSFRSTNEIEEDELKAGTTKTTLALIPQPFSLSATLLGSPETIVKPGTELIANVAYENKGNRPLENAKIGITVDSRFVSPNTIMTDEKTVPALSRLEPGAHGTVSIPFKLLSNISPLPNDLPSKNFILTIHPIGQAAMTNGATVAIESIGPELTRRIETPFIITTAAHYWTTEGDQIGRGPMPPIVGSTTKYWIFWKISPTTNDTDHISVTAVLPDGVTFAGPSNVTVGNPVKWYPDSQVVQWSIDHLDATLGTGQVITGRFEVALTPTADQVGKTPVLLGTTEVTATDAFTNTSLSTQAPAITTLLPTDRRAVGKGVVQKK